MYSPLPGVWFPTRRRRRSDYPPLPVKPKAVIIEAMPYATWSLGWWVIRHAITKRHTPRPRWLWWYAWEGTGVWCCRKCHP